MGKGHLPWSNFMVHGVNRPLNYVYHSFTCAQLRRKHIRPTYLSEDTSEFEVAPSKTFC